MPNNFYGCFRHETCVSEDCCRIAKFLVKTTSRDIAQKMLTSYNDDPDLLKMFITGDEAWEYGYGIETKAQSFH